MTRRGAETPSIRLIWDELLSPRVAEALRVLGFNVTWVGSTRDDGVPPKGSTDADVIAFARATNQIVVTSNHDMMTLCDEADQRFVWIDPYGRPLRREQQVILAFTQIAEWQRLLEQHPDRCVMARRTRCVPIESHEAARRARNRMRSLERRRRTRQRKRRPSSGELNLDVD